MGGFAWLCFGQGDPGGLEAGDQAPMQQDVPPEERSLTDVHLLLVFPNSLFFPPRKSLAAPCSVF